MEKLLVRKLVIVLIGCFVLSCKGILSMMHFFFWNWFECFVILVNGRNPLTIITKRSILDVATVLDPPLATELTSISREIIRIRNQFQKKKCCEIIRIRNQFQMKKCIINKIPSQDSTKHAVNTITNFLTDDFSTQHLFLWSNKTNTDNNTLKGFILFNLFVIFIFYINYFHFLSLLH